MVKIFISYRREDADFQAHSLCKRLREKFGEGSVMIDVDTIPPGVDFRRHLSECVRECDVLLAVVGERWLDARSEDGARRLDDPADFVRIELEQALSRDIRVIPVVFGQAYMPRDFELPDPLRDFAFRNAVFVRSGKDFEPEIERLIQASAKSGRVFISARSHDFKHAQAVFNYLRGKGIDVFLSEASLPEVGSTDYRDAIDNALDAARHMIVVTSSKENVLSDWVKAEWGLFINEKRSGYKTGNLLTVLVGDMNPRDLPASLRYFEFLRMDEDPWNKILQYVRR